MRKGELGNMLKANRKLVLLCLGAVLSMAMYGCSGSSQPEPSGPTPAEQIQAAQAAATMAAAAAKTAADSARAAVNGVSGMQDADSASFTAASNAAQAAQDANTAAVAANAVASLASTPDAARAAQALVEAARDAAQAALVNAETSAGMVASAHQMQQDEMEEMALAKARAAEAMALADAKAAAQMAADAAMMASNNAAAAVDGVMANQGADQASFDRASAAAAAAATANDAAQAANTAAQGAGMSADAIMYQEAAETAQANAEAAEGNATMYAGMVASAHKMDQDNMAIAGARTLAAAAVAAAKTAAETAEAAVAGVMGMQGADAMSFATASNAAQAARDAYNAAVAASAVADGASTPEAALAAQGKAEDARDAAQANLGDAQTYAGMVATAHADQEIEKTALANEQDLAKMAAAAAMKAWDDAKDAVDGVMDGADADPASYGKATTALNAAAAANDEAKAANERAKMAADSGDARTARMDAETAQENAETASGNAIMYAEIVDTKDGAQNAAMAARMAADEAQARVDAVKENKDASLVNYGKAEAAAAEADRAAEAAEEAYADARAARTAAEAAPHKATAEDEQDRAERAGERADIYANAVADAHQDDLDDAAEAKALADAKAGAMTASNGAKMAAVDARAAATKVAELLGADSDYAVEAAKVATAAEAAAMSAMDASDRAKVATKSTDAEAEQLIAEKGETDAKASLLTAMNMAAQAQIAFDEGKVQREKAALLAAQGGAQDAADAAKGHYESAMGKALLADGQATNARAAATRAARARRDSTEAAVQAEKAELAAMDANEARDRAETAKDDAATAALAAQEAETSTVAKTHQADAETANLVATENHTGETGAGMAYMRAKAAAELAETAASTHVLALFMEANAYGINRDDATEEKKLRDAEIDSIGTAMAGAATADAAGRAGGVGGSVEWEPGDPGEDEDGDPIPDVPMVTITGSDLAGDADERTSKGIDGIGMFSRGFAVTSPRTRDADGAVTNAGNSHVLAFTNKVKEVAAVEASSAKSVKNAMVTDVEQIVSVTQTASPILGESFRGTFQPAEDEGPPLAGTFSCAESAPVCELAVTGEGDNIMITTAVGYTFTGSRPAVAAVSPDAQNEYLLFGIWLSEVTEGGDTFGAFAGGPTSYTKNVEMGVTGRATYDGSAVGARHMSREPISYFDGKARLTAEFGTDVQAGTIEGSIYDIFMDGKEQPDTETIRLQRATLTDGSSVFNGTAGMRPQTAPGLASHVLNGNWDGQFFGNRDVVDDSDTTDVDESKENSPGAVAGTFGVTNTETTGTGDDAVTTTESFVGAFGAHVKE
jgi:hypothetical protein